MIENIAKKKIREGQPVLLAGLTIADPNIAEMFALCGADIVMIDNEHMTFDDTRLVDCCRAVTMHGKTCLLRTSVKDPEILGRYMQFGFQGIVATVCHGLEDAKRVISAVKYPPVGKKGLSNECRASEFGIRGGMNTAEYMQWSNDNSIVIITVDGEQAAVDLLREGKINCVVECTPMLGETVMELAEKLKAGETVPRILHPEETMFTEYDSLEAIAPRGY